MDILNKKYLLYGEAKTTQTLVVQNFDSNSCNKGSKCLIMKIHYFGTYNCFATIKK